MSASSEIITSVSPSVRQTGRSARKAASKTMETAVLVPAEDKIKIKPDGEVDIVPPKDPKMEKDIPKKEKKAAKKAAKKEEKEERCSSGMTKCPPLTLFIAFAIIVLLFSAFRAWSKSPPSGTPGNQVVKYWLGVGFSFIIMIVLILAIGWWIKAECSNCQPGKAWLVFVLAIFLPIVVGFAFSVVIGALRGGASFIDKFLGKCGDPIPPKKAAEAPAQKKAAAPAQKKAAAPAQTQTTQNVEEEPVALEDEHTPDNATREINAEDLDEAINKIK